MKGFIYSFSTIVILTTVACGLKYTPPVSKERVMVDRQKAVTDYIRASYKDSTITYHSISFANPTTVKPYIYEQLDSLYEIKFQNEQLGKYDKELEEKIANQRIIIQSSNQKVKHVEHHVYVMQTPQVSHAYFSDILFDENGQIDDYKASASYSFPTNQLQLFKTYMTGESFIQTGYAATQGENDIIQLMSTELDKKSGEEANEYFQQMMNVFSIIKQTKQVEIKNILKNLVILNTENRLFNTTSDKIIRTDGLMQDKKLVGYEIEFETPTGKKTLIYTPNLELVK